MGTRPPGPGAGDGDGDGEGEGDGDGDGDGDGEGAERCVRGRSRRMKTLASEWHGGNEE
jgi:hypothetical protein